MHCVLIVGVKWYASMCMYIDMYINILHMYVHIACIACMMCLCGPCVYMGISVVCVHMYLHMYACIYVCL